MISAMKLEVTVENTEQTMLFAKVLATKLRGGEAIELIGDVGAGKTTFVHGLMTGLESDDPVTSPTFTINNVYDSGRLPVYHFDFYRLGDNDTMIKHELTETVEREDAVIVLEWAQPLRSVLPQKPISIHITNLGEHARKFVVTIPEHYAYIGSAE